MDNIFVHDWNYTKNWPYVVLSHIRTHNSLYCGTKLSKDLSNYAMPSGLSCMLQRFRNLCAATYWTEEDYERLFNVE